GSRRRRHWTPARSSRSSPPPSWRRRSSTRSRPGPPARPTRTCGTAGRATGLPATPSAGGPPRAVKKASRPPRSGAPPRHAAPPPAVPGREPDVPERGGAHRPRGARAAAQPGLPGRAARPEHGSHADDPADRRHVRRPDRGPWGTHARGHPGIKLTAGMTIRAPDLLEEPSLRQVLGRPVLRSEDRALLTGTARYLDDVPCEGALHAVFARSPRAHARVRSVDTGDAGAMPGVVGVFTAADVGGLRMPAVEDSPEVFARPLLAIGRVRFVGEPVAVVVARTRAQAMDAADAVAVDYEPL